MVNGYIAHHGILGQKWGVRRYQNKDGSLTDAGKKRYGASDVKNITSRKGIQRRLNDLDEAIARNRRQSGDEKINASKYQRKSNKARSYVRQETYKNMANESQSKSAKYANNILKGQQEVYRLLEQAKKSGLTVEKTFTRRDVTTGKDWLKSLGLSAIFLPAGIISYATYNANGTKYKVKDKYLNLSKNKKKAYDAADKADILNGKAELAALKYGPNSKQYNKLSKQESKEYDKYKKYMKKDRER